MRLTLILAGNLLHPHLLDASLKFESGFEEEGNLMSVLFLLFLSEKYIDGILLPFFSLFRRSEDRRVVLMSQAQLG